MKREDVLKILSEHLPALAEDYDVASLSLFGSVARNEALPGSDVDILVEFKQPVGLFQFIGLQQHLESILGRKVDLGTRRSLKLSVQDHILHEAIRVT